MYSLVEKGLIQTVTGLIKPDELGITLTHEHLLFDSSYKETKLPIGYTSQIPTEASLRDLYYKPVSFETLGWIRHHGIHNIDNGKLLDINTAIEEVDLFKQYGGGTLVDVTSIGIARDPIGLARISRHTGVNIVMGASFYVDEAHPVNMDEISEDEIFEKIVEDITEGVDGTGIKSGIIGEVGCSWPLTDNELKVLRASGRAQLATGAPLLIHPGRHETSPFEIIDILKEVGTDLTRTVMGHVDRTISKREDFERLAETGCYVEWDLFGTEQSYYIANPNGIDMPNDATRMDQIGWLLEGGYEDKIVIAHDICSKQRLIKYGGHGYFYIISHIVPRMRSRGFSDDTIDKILIDNPKSILAFTNPS